MFIDERCEPIYLVVKTEEFSLIEGLRTRVVYPKFKYDKLPKQCKKYGYNYRDV